MLTTVFLQFSKDNKTHLLEQGEFVNIPENGDEIVFQDQIYLVLKKRWKVEHNGFETKCKVALLCEIKT